MALLNLNFFSKTVLVCALIYFLFVLIPYPQAVNVINWVALILLFVFVYKVVKGRFPEVSGLELWFFVFSFAYLLIYPVSLLWTENLDWGYQVVERHGYFLLFPILLVVGKRCDTRKMINAFILSMMFVELFSYGIWLGWWQDPAGYGTVQNPVAFTPHTVYTYLASFTYFLIVWKLLFEGHRFWISRVILAFFAISITVNIFLNGGRGGQLAWILMTLVLLGAIVVRFKLSWRKGIWIFGGGLGVIALVLTSAYQFNPLVKQRADRAVHELMHYSPKSGGSWAFRLHMYHNTLKMLRQGDGRQWLLGAGIGDFPEVYNQHVDPQRYRFYLTPNLRGHFHPHNQFLFDLGSVGLLGLGALLGMLSVLAVAVWRLRQHPEHFIFGMGFLVMSIWMMLPDSLLLSRSTQLLFILFSYVLIRFSVNEKVAV